MEVHHHSHSHGKKNWKSYFWEFLMLFLAVFCGFLAEYQLEHKIESDRAKQYIISFYEDLKTDTAEFANHIRTDRYKTDRLNIVFDCYRELERNPHKDSCLRQLIHYSSSFLDLIFTDRTLLQLKNAGGMRLLKKEDADSIMVYDYNLRRYSSFESSVLQERQTNLRKTYNELLNFKSKRTFSLSVNNYTEADEELILFSTDKAQLNKLFNEIYSYSEVIKNARIFLINKLKENAERLLIYFNKKYNIE